MKIAALAMALGILVAPAGAGPQGTLFIIGGGDRPPEMMKRFVDLAAGFGTGKIVIFPMASSEPAASGAGLVEEFRKLGAPAAESVILTREQALLPESVRVLDGAGGVFFAGGDQSRLTAALLGTPIHKRMLELYALGAVIGGTSAGAAVMSRVMITGDEKRKVEEGHEFETLEAGNVITTEGFGFVETAIIDQHFATRKRHNRLLSLLAEHPALMGIGIDEETAVVIHPDATLDVIGLKNVIVFDPAGAVVTATSDKAVGFTGLVVHILLPGSRFDLISRKVLGR